MSNFTRYYTPQGYGAAVHPCGKLYRREEVDAYIEAMEARVEALEQDLKAVLRREEDANRAAMKHLRALEQERIKSANYAAFSTEWRKKCDTLEARVAAADALADILVQVPSALNAAFGAGSEEREGGSARRQAKYMEKPEMLRREIPTALAAYRATKEQST